MQSGALLVNTSDKSTVPGVQTNRDLPADKSPDQGALQIRDDSNDKSPDQRMLQIHDDPSDKSPDQRMLQIRDDSADNLPDQRILQIHSWLQQIDGMAGATLTPASADASFRRYFRARKNGASRIVMDAPPDWENCEQFVRVASQLRAMKLNVPHVFEADLAQGFLLLTDFGSESFLKVLRQDPSKCDALYTNAIDALITMQREGVEFQKELPTFDQELIRTELALFSDWLCGVHLGIEFSEVEQAEWRATNDLLVRNAVNQPQVFVHLDYHSRNLMQVDDNSLGILDFQDAMSGPYTYDLVSLLKDCYINWPPEKVSQWAEYFFRQREKAIDGPINHERFVHHFELMGVQRQLKASGIFARLNHRDNKSGYMSDIPRTLNYIQAIASRYEGLDFLSRLLSERVVPGLR